MATEITEKTIKKFLRNYNADTVTKFVSIGNSDKNIEISVKRLVSPATMKYMIDSVVDIVFTDDVYDPSIKNLIKWVVIMQNVTNVTAQDLTDDQFSRLVYGSDITDAINDVWNIRQSYDFDAAVDEAIAYKKQEIANVQKIRLDNIMSQLDTLVGYMKNMTDSFKDVDPDTMASVMKNLSSMTEKDLCSNVIEIRGKQDEPGAST